MKKIMSVLMCSFILITLVGCSQKSEERKRCEKMYAAVGEEDKIEDRCSDY